MMRRKHLESGSITLVAITLLWLIPAFAAAQQNYCRDLFAASFMQPAKPESTCSYPLTLRQPKLAFELPNRIEESSGLLFFKGLLWSHNDSGGEAELYGIDTLDGKIKSTILVTNAKNTDWEDIAQDEQAIYIADFGNNAGARKDLVIYRIDKKLITGQYKQSVEAEMIRFVYPEQRNFNVRWKKHNFDCEALIAGDTSLYLFTKNWDNARTDLYALPKKAGDYAAQHLGSYDSQGVVTGADLNAETGVLALVGYEPKLWRPFIILFYDFTGEDFFGGFSRKIELSNLITTQTEGICFVAANELMISAEYSKTFSARVFDLPIGQWTDKRAYATRKGDRESWKPNWTTNNDGLTISWQQTDATVGEQILWLVDAHGNTRFQADIKPSSEKQTFSIALTDSDLTNWMAILADRKNIYYAIPQTTND